MDDWDYAVDTSADIDPSGYDSAPVEVFANDYDLGGDGFGVDQIGGTPVDIGGIAQYLAMLSGTNYAPVEESTPVPIEELQASLAGKLPFGQTMKPADYSLERINAALAAYAQQGVPSTQTSQPTGAAKPTGAEAIDMIKGGEYLKGIEALLGSSLGKALFAGGLGLASFMDAKNQNTRDLTKGTRAAFESQLQKPKQYPTYYYPGQGGLSSLNRTGRPLA